MASARSRGRQIGGYRAALNVVFDDRQLIDIESARIAQARHVLFCTRPREVGQFVVHRQQFARRSEAGWPSSARSGVTFAVLIRRLPIFRALEVDRERLVDGGLLVFLHHDLAFVRTDRAAVDITRLSAFDRSEG